MRKALFLIIGIFLFAFDIKPVPEMKVNTQKAKLGKRLFCDTRLSKNKDVSCASCHSLKRYGVDNLQYSIGSGGVIDKPMNTPSVYNTYFNVAWFWNGRAGSLQQQAIDAFTDKKEHNMNVSDIEKVVLSDSGYVRDFKKIYGKAPDINLIADAIAEFEKSLVTLNCRFDRYLKGDEHAITPKEKRGYMKFKQYGCITCHNGVNVGGNSYQKMGIFMQYIDIQRGRDRYLVTHFPADKYTYKVPGLRNVAKTYPYFHDGSVKTLDKAIELMGELNLGIKFKKEDVSDIKAFLETLTGEIHE